MSTSFVKFKVNVHTRQVIKISLKGTHKLHRKNILKMITLMINCKHQNFLSNFFFVFLSIRFRWFSSYTEKDTQINSMNILCLLIRYHQSSSYHIIQSLFTWESDKIISIIDTLLEAFCFTDVISFNGQVTKCINCFVKQRKQNNRIVEKSNRWL